MLIAVVTFLLPTSYRERHFPSGLLYIQPSGEIHRLAREMAINFLSTAEREIEDLICVRFAGVSPAQVKWSSRAVCLGLTIFTLWILPQQKELMYIRKFPGN